MIGTAIPTTVGDVVSSESDPGREVDLAVTYRIHSMLRESGPDEEFPQKVLNILEAERGFKYAAVMLREPKTGRLRPTAVTRHGPELSDFDSEYMNSFEPDVGQGITGWVARTGESVRSGNVRADSRYLPVRDCLSSELCVPIQIRGHVYGILNVESERRNAFVEDDQALVESVAVTLAVALRCISLERRLGSANLPETGIGVTALGDLIPICAGCKRIRDTIGTWRSVESYSTARWGVAFTHGICPHCTEALDPE